MATKQLNGRIQWKRDTSANWESNNPILLDGEIIIVTTNAGETRFKVGDGVKTYTQLPFQDEAVRALITELSEIVDTKLTTPSGTKGQFLGYIDDNVVGAVSVPYSYFDAEYNNTLTTIGWLSSGSSEYAYQQSFTINNIENSLFFVYPEYTSNKLEEKDSWNLIEEVEVLSNFVIFYTNTKTNVNINFGLIYKSSN